MLSSLGRARRTRSSEASLQILPLIGSMRTMPPEAASLPRSRGADMATLARNTKLARESIMDDLECLDAETAWSAFMARDRAFDGRVFGAVKSTGIYCKPSCPARRPKRENVEFFGTAAQARSAGYRPCMRCKPDRSEEHTSE